MPGAVITGASGKLGRVLSLALARHGYSLVLHFHKRREALADLEEELAAMGGRAVCRACDFTRPDERAAFIRESFDENTAILINSAACFSKGNMAATSAEELAHTFALNTFAPFALITGFAAARTERAGQGVSRHVNGEFQNEISSSPPGPHDTGRGLVLNILDSKIFHDASGYAAYTLSKKSLAESTRLAAREFAPVLRVNAIALACLSPTEDASYDALCARAPLGHVGSEEDLVCALEFFLRAGGVTGQCLSIDGGLSLR
jgi:NAD(P)-dependent dehydrogenase (short-subunit alcohol dehydrogenase family)